MKRIISLVLSLLLILSAFSLSAYAVESTLEISDATYPTFLDKGMSFSIGGTITSNSAITSVTVGVYNKSTGTAVITKTQAPNTRTYYLSDMDPYITFGSLKESNYIYKITASDKLVQNKVLLTKDFVVGIPNGTVGDEMQNVNWKVIDISQWQPDVNWSQLKNEVDAVILRIGYRTTGDLKICEDEKFFTHYKNAVAAGIPVGVYFFSAALSVTAVKEEAKFVIDTLKKYDCELKMPVYIDMESDKQYALGRTACNKLANTFCEAMIEENYFPGIYCNLSWATTALVASSLSRYTFWLAQYASAPTYEGKFEMWQYSQYGSVKGISVYVDLNKCYKNIPAYISKMGYNQKPSANCADYTELDELIKIAPKDLSVYTVNTKSAFEKAMTQAENLNRYLQKTEQSKVDEAAKTLRNAICGLALSGGFEANENSDIVFDDNNQKVTGIPQNTTQSALLSDYITLKGTAKIEYTNLSDNKIVKGTVIYIKINTTTIAKYTVA